VDALVQKDSAIDGHAAHNTTSVYTPAVIFPMLTAELSTNLTSLNENQDRVAMVTDMVFAADGSARRDGVNIKMTPVSRHWSNRVCTESSYEGNTPCRLSVMQHILGSNYDDITRLPTTNNTKAFDQGLPERQSLQWQDPQVV